MRLPVRTALLQNRTCIRCIPSLVRLPVRTALLQNYTWCRHATTRCDYQSERHCSKTGRLTFEYDIPCDYQSERHCSKTPYAHSRPSHQCDYQSERHCSKTIVRVSSHFLQCDYQSERHCSKTQDPRRPAGGSCDYQSERHCSKTSMLSDEEWKGAITSQNGTAPKRSLRLPILVWVRLPVRTALLQNQARAIAE